MSVLGNLNTIKLKCENFTLFKEIQPLYHWQGLRLVWLLICLLQDAIAQKCYLAQTKSAKVVESKASPK